MANTLNIPEHTLAEITDPLLVSNAIGLNAGERKSWDTPMTVRISDHQDNDAAATDDPDKMALFTSKYYGHPWIKTANVLEQVIHSEYNDGTLVSPAPAPANASVIYPAYPYSLFE